MNTESFAQCLKSDDVDKFIDYDIEEARALDVSGTPYLFILSDSLKTPKRILGELSQEELAQIISDLLPTVTQE
jgi:protein-disulfide isomerase